MKHALILEDGEPFSEDDNKPENQVLADVEKKSYNVKVVTWRSKFNYQNCLYIILND